MNRVRGRKSWRRRRSGMRLKRRRGDRSTEKRPNTRRRSKKRRSRKPKLSCTIRATVFEAYMWVLHHHVIHERCIQGHDGLLPLPPPPPQSALLLAEVLKEREAQIDLKHRIRNTNRDVEKRFLDEVKSREDEARRQEEERALQRKMEIQAVAQDLTKQ